MVNTGIELRDSIREWLHNTPYPEFHGEIEKRVTGQEDLKQFTTIVYHYLECVEDSRPVRCNTILAAPSGSGKTETYRALRDYFRKRIPELPVYVYDASQITATGFKGVEPSDVLTPFFSRGIRDAIGICFLDEMDKKLAPAYTSDGTNVNAEAQYNLLTIVEGSEIHDKRGLTVDTTNVMFVGLGSFNEFREARKGDGNPIGIFTGEEKRKIEEETDHFAKITRGDMIKAGGSYELIGRFPYIVNYHSLDREAILNVVCLLTETVATGFDCNLEIEDEMLEALIESANSEFGCRLIESVIRESVLDAYTKAISEEHEGKVLEIQLKSPDEATSYWREPTEEEIEEDRIFSLERSEHADFTTVWDDDGSDLFKLLSMDVNG